MMRRVLAMVAACCALASVAGAQTPTPVLLVHGFNSDSDTWNATRDFLDATGNYQASAIHLIWQQHLANQAAVVASRLSSSGVGPATIVVGHSQGGLVSRMATRTSPVLGLLTIGSPHAGAPIANSRTQLQIDVGEVNLDEALIQIDMPEFCDNHPDDFDCSNEQVVEDAIALGAVFEIAVTIWGEYRSTTMISLTSGPVPALSPLSKLSPDSSRQSIAYRSKSTTTWNGRVRFVSNLVPTRRRMQPTR